MIKEKRVFFSTGGFSFLELLMVMGIMSLLLTFTIISYKGSQATSRDTQRRSDLKQYQTILETRANTNGGFYPGHQTEVSASVDLCSNLSLSDCPTDPYDGEVKCQGETCGYLFQSNSCDDGSSCATQFVLYTYLEKTNNIFVVCSSGSSGEVVNTTTFSSGGCPTF